MCILFHKWGKWQEYKRKVIVFPGRIAPKVMQGTQFESLECRQKRACLRCGKVQDKIIIED